jgi:hypothetical protein
MGKARILALVEELTAVTAPDLPSSWSHSHHSLRLFESGYSSWEYICCPTPLPPKLLEKVTPPLSMNQVKHPRPTLI